MQFNSAVPYVRTIRRLSPPFAIALGFLILLGAVAALFFGLSEMLSTSVCIVPGGPEIPINSRGVAPVPCAAWFWESVVIAGAGVVTLTSALVLRARPDRHRVLGTVIAAVGACVVVENFFLAAVDPMDNSALPGAIPWSVVLVLGFLLALFRPTFRDLTYFQYVPVVYVPVYPPPAPPPPPGAGSTPTGRP